MGRACPIEGTAVDVGAWLRGLGLGQYEQAFRENDIDAEVLPRLTADDLKELGVTPVGHGASCSTPSALCVPAGRRRPSEAPTLAPHRALRCRFRPARPSGASSR